MAPVAVSTLTIARLRRTEDENVAYLADMAILTVSPDSAGLMGLQILP